MWDYLTAGIIWNSDTIRVNGGILSHHYGFERLVSDDGMKWVPVKLVALCYSRAYGLY